jgi:hypothetical protein
LCEADSQEWHVAKFVKFISASDPRLEVHINPDEVAAVRDSHGKTIILFRGVAATETVSGSVANVVAALEGAQRHV